MTDREVKRLTPNSIANLLMADEAWHDSLYVKAEDYDSLLADFEALRTALAAPSLEVTVDPRLTPDEAAAISSALAAPRPEPEPVAYFDLQKQVFFWAKPTMIDVPMTVALNPLPLYAAPPAAAPEPTHPGYILGSHWLETAYSRICAGEAEADVLRDCGWERVADNDALRRDAERYRWLLDWLVRTGLLTAQRCRIDAPETYGDWYILRKPYAIDGSVLVGYGKTEDAAIDAAIKGDKK